MGKAARAKHVAFTSHDPERTDDQLDRIAQKLEAQRRPHDPTLTIAYEGLEFDL